MEKLPKLGLEAKWEYAFLGTGRKARENGRSFNGLERKCCCTDRVMNRIGSVENLCISPIF
jgi:hypothetical protein